jgi:hypothetical protein
MRIQILSPVHLNRLPMIPVVYTPQDIHTFAIQVTPETIGAMAIEFQVEVESQQRSRWLSVRLERKNGATETVSVARRLDLGEWLVVLNDEIHIFPPDVFQYTFGQDQEPTHQQDDPSVTGFMDLGPGFTNRTDPNYQQQLPEMPQIN